VDETSRAVLDDEARPRTVGERLDGVGRRIAARHRWTSAVGERLVPPLRRLERLAEQFAGRFERVESGGDGPEVVSFDVLTEVPWPVAPGTGSSPPDADRPIGLGSAEGRALPADVRSRLRDLAGPGADVVRVHDDVAADHIARAHSADAVTIGADVYFRDGRFRPDEPTGLGLLAHETTHVSTTLENHGAARATAAGLAAEEHVALAREWLAQGQLPGMAATAGRLNPIGDPGTRVVGPAGRAAGPPTGRGPAGASSDDARGSPPGAIPTAAPTGVTPMTAALDRPSAPQPSFDVDALRRDLVVELMSRLRSDFERGA
jgi:hypothetical protein